MAQTDPKVVLAVDEGCGGPLQKPPLQPRQKPRAGLHPWGSMELRASVGDSEELGVGGCLPDPNVTQDPNCMDARQTL